VIPVAYRVWYLVDAGSTRFPGAGRRIHLPVRSPLEAYDVIRGLLEGTRRDEEAGRILAAGLEQRAIGGWKPWYDDGGLDVMQRFAVEETLEVAVAARAY
jgi:hypothetical protein